MTTAMYALTLSTPPDQDTTVLAEIVDRLHLRYPGVIEGYQYERVDKTTVHLMLWGEIVDDTQQLPPR